LQSADVKSPCDVNDPSIKKSIPAHAAVSDAAHEPTHVFNFDHHLSTPGIIKKGNFDMSSVSLGEVENASSNFYGCHVIKKTKMMPGRALFLTLIHAKRMVIIN